MTMSDDASARFSLLEMDCAPGEHTFVNGRCTRCTARDPRPAQTPAQNAPSARPAPAAPTVASAPATQPSASQTAFCACRSELPPSAALPLAVRGSDGVRRCPRCNRARAPQPRTEPASRAESPSETPAEFSDVQRSPALALRTEQRVETRARTEQATVVETVNRAPQLRRGDIVAGAAAEGHGVLLGFQGAGELTRSRLVQILTGAGFPVEWAPAAKSAHAQAGRILMALNQAGYICRYDRPAKRNAVANTSAASQRQWAARWFVVRGRSESGDIGTAYGSVIMTATLSDGGELRLESTDGALAKRVGDSFREAIDAEIYTATDVSSWLRSVLVVRFAAAALGGTWYVRREHARAAEQLLTAFSRVRWGTNWLLPALPVASSDQLRSGIAAGFIAEVQDVLDEYRAKRDEARAERKPLSPRTAATLHGKLAAVIERCVGFAALLGDGHIAPIRARAIAASEEIQQSMTGLEIRFANIFDDLARDARRGA